MSDKKEYYVYVYIDPRNNEEFYYGKGKGNRKTAHLKENQKDSEKAKRIDEIKKVGIEPIVRVIATGLSNSEALLIESTLIWKLRGFLTNQVAGHSFLKFRPKNTLHKLLTGFDFENRIYYVNIEEDEQHSWEDCCNYSFISAGQDKKYSKPLQKLQIGDVVIPYIPKKGYVGIGVVVNTLVDVESFKHKGKSLRSYTLKATNIFKNSDNGKSEYLVKVSWKKTVGSDKAIREKGLFYNQNIVADMTNQQKTLNILQKAFGIEINGLLC